MSTSANSVRIVKSENGGLYTAYKSNPDFGYILVEEVAMDFSAGWMREKRRTAFIKAETKLLAQFAAQYAGKALPGRIVVQEFVESEVPANHQSKIKNVEQREQFYKKNPKTDTYLTAGGERILRFSDWDPTGKLEDISVAHDVVPAGNAVLNAVAAQAESQAPAPTAQPVPATAEAQLPGDDGAPF